MNSWSHIIVCMACALMANPCVAIEPEHEVAPTVTSNGPRNKLELDDELEKSAQDYAKKGSVERFVSTDAAMPRDAEEYRRLGGYGVILVVAISHDAAELPLKQVYLNTNSSEIPLRQLYRIRVDTPEGSTERQIFGQYRDYAFYLMPISSVLGPHKILCDFASNRDGFLVENDPMEAPQYLTPSLRDVTSKQPTSALLSEFIRREWPGVAGNLDEKNMQ